MDDAAKLSQPVARAVDAPVARQICQLCYRVPPPRLRITKWHEMRRIEGLPVAVEVMTSVCRRSRFLLGFALVTTSVFFRCLVGNLPRSFRSLLIELGPGGSHSGADEGPPRTFTTRWKGFSKKGTT